MRERAIKRGGVKKALIEARNIDHIEDDKFMVHYRINSETLTVVFIKQKEYYTIITAYYEDNL